MTFNDLYKSIIPTVECVSPPPPENGAVQTVYSTSYQLLAVFMCDEGFTAVGETVLSCVEGEWDKTAPTCACKQSCIMPCIQ